MLSTHSPKSWSSNRLDVLHVAEHTKFAVLCLFPKSTRAAEQALGGTGGGGILLIDTPCLAAKVCKWIGIHQLVSFKGWQVC